MFNYETIIGIEVHAELNTKYKIFSPALNNINAEPNTNIHPIDLGLPGTLPRFNKEILDKAILICHAFDMKITKNMHWDRKNYFYADNPKGYQITQQQTPIGRHGNIVLDNGKKIEISFMHMEEDTAKSIHQENQTVLDFNRCGVPLVEIVSGPDMRSASEAREYLEKLRETLLYLGVSDCKMEEGSLRVDVNISVRPIGFEKFNNKVEIKNLNSFKNVELSIQKEVSKQILAYSTGQKIYQATKRFNEATKDVILMRIKESAVDYRFFPEPDLPRIVLDDKYINDIKLTLPILPKEIKEELKKLKFNDKEIESLLLDKDMTNFFFKSLEEGLSPKQMFNYLTVNINEFLNKEKLNFTSLIINYKQFKSLEKLLKDDKISSKHVKEIIPMMLVSNDTVENIVKDNNLEQITNIETITSWVNKVIENNPENLKIYQEGKKAAFGFFIGEIMKISKGQVSPKLANEILTKRLEEL